MAYTPNQITDAFQSSLKRAPTDYELKTYATVSPQSLAGLKDTYGKYNTSQSIVDYLKHSGIDPATAGDLGKKYGISGIGTAEGNTALLTALRSGAPAPVAAPLQGSVAAPAAAPAPHEETAQPAPVQAPTPAPATAQPQPEAAASVAGSVAGAAGAPDPIAESKKMVDTAYAEQQRAQQAVAAIDALLSKVKSDKMAEISRSGGVVNETSLMSEIMRENEPLLQQRKQLVTEYTSANQAYQKAVSDKNASDANFYKSKTLDQGQQKIDNQADQAAAKFEQSGWKQTKVNQYDDYGNVVGQVVQWSQSPANGGAAPATGNLSGIPAASGGGSHAAQNILPGAKDTSIPLRTAVASYGMDAIVAGIIKNEGGSLPGVQFNPGNIKFAGLPGQTDSGVSNDGGKSTFANYASAEEGKAAIAAIVQRAADGKSSAYGTNPSFQDFVNKYTNTTPNTSASGAVSNSSIPAIVPLATGASVDVSTPGYTTSNVTYNGKDTQLTQSYIDQTAIAAIMAGGTIPSSVSRATKGLPVVQMNAIKARIGQLDPGGNLALNKVEAAAWGATLKKQIDYATTLQRSLSAADADFHQILEKYKGTGINDGSMPISNMLANASKYHLGQGDVSAFKASLAELSNLYQQVFSRSGQVTDSVRATSKEIIDGNISLDNLTKVADQLQQLGKVDLDQVNNTIQDAENKYRGIVPGADQGGAFQPKGSMSDQDFVEKALTSHGLKYEDVVAKYKTSLQAGEQLALDNNTGEIVAASKTDISSGNYTPL